MVLSYILDLLLYGSKNQTNARALIYTAAQTEKSVIMVIGLSGVQFGL